MKDLKKRRQAAGIEANRRLNRRLKTIEQVESDLTEAQRQLTAMNTGQQRSQEEYYGTTRQGDKTRSELRAKVDYLTRILEAIISSGYDDYGFTNSTPDS